MEFWARLVKGGSPLKKQNPPSNNPQVRLGHLKHAYNSLLQIWHNGEGLTEDVFVIENICVCLRRVAELFRDDQRGPTPHLCISFAAASRILVTVARVSAAFQTEPIATEALSICQLLIDTEEEAFLEDRGFVDTLPDFVESVQRLGVQSEEDEMETTLVEMLFGITAKLRVEPHLLRAWFRPEKPEDDQEDLTTEERRTRWEEFPLFYTILHYVPFQGRMGEFSRMGLVYVVEMATQSSDLEKWLVEGDMAALMASGLGALYSQLSRKLAFHYSPGETPSILAFSEQQAAATSSDAESTVSDTYQSHLGTFLSSLKFWQDLIEHCRSEDVRQTLLDHFEYLFLQQLLYPSLVESSDVDGGSSVAVLTYLRHILEHIDNLDLTRLTLQYLFGLQRSVDYKRMPSTPLSRTRRRKSADLLTRFNDEGQPTPELFNLSALIFTSLKSDSQQTVTATLHILSAMLRGPHHQSLTSLLRTRPTSASDPRRTIGAHEKEIETLLSLAEDLTGFQDIEISYEQHIHDNRDNLESHPCSIELLNLPVTNQSATLFEPERTKLTQKVLKLEDPTFINLVALLDKYFKNDIETNLALTQVLVDLASCGYLRLELWLLSSPLTYQYPTDRKPVLSNGAPQMDEETSEIKLERLHQLRSTRLSPRILPESTSPLLQSLTRLTSIVSDFRRVITNFDSNLHICRGIIDLPSRQTTPILTPSRSPSRPPPAQATPIRKGHNLTTPILTPMTVSSRIITSNSSTRNVSPRGRQGKQEPEQGTSPSLISRLRYLQLSPSRTPLSQSSINTPSRSPFRDANPGLPFPLIPVTLWQRIRVEQQTQPRTSQVPDDEDSDTESDASSTVPDIGELSPTDVIATPSKSRHLAISTNSTARVRKHSNPSAGGRGRDGKYERKHVAINFNNEESDDSVDPKPFDTGLRTEPKNDGTVSLGHLLTNIIILQEFILELAAIVEVRGTLFEEVDL